MVGPGEAMGIMFWTTICILLLGYGFFILHHEYQRSKLDRKERRLELKREETEVKREQAEFTRAELEAMKDDSPNDRSVRSDGDGHNRRSR